MTSHSFDDDARDALAAELEQLVDAIPGVAHIYQPRATLPALHAAKEAADGDLPAPPPRVEICDDNTVALTIATDPDSPSPEVAHQVHDVLLDRLTQAGIDIDRVDVRIARVE